MKKTNLLRLLKILGVFHPIRIFAKKHIGLKIINRFNNLIILSKLKNKEVLLLKIMDTVDRKFNRLFVFRGNKGL